MLVGGCAEGGKLRRSQAPELQRIVVAIDPSRTGGEEADECGIVAAGVDKDGTGWVLTDASGRYQPTEWAKRAIELYYRLKADRIVAETNFGGEMVAATIRAIDRNVAYRPVSVLPHSRQQYLCDKRYRKCALRDEVPYLRAQSRLSCAPQPAMGYCFRRDRGPQRGDLAAGVPTGRRKDGRQGGGRTDRCHSLPCNQSLYWRAATGGKSDISDRVVHEHRRRAATCRAAANRVPFRP
jgi:hypothetical protein